MNNAPYKNPLSRRERQSENVIRLFEQREFAVTSLRRTGDRIFIPALEFLCFVSFFKKRNEGLVKKKTSKGELEKLLKIAL